MKWVLLLLAIGPLALGVYAQGVVDFNNNRNFQTATNESRLVFYSDGTRLVGTNYAAQLYYGADAASLQPVTTAPARFRPPTTTAPGTWSGGNRTLTGFTAGMTVILQVAVWDTSVGLTFDQARAAGVWWTQSSPFTYTIPAAGSPPAAFYMENLRGFTCIPEPSIIGFGLVGGLTMLLFRRRTASQT